MSNISSLFLRCCRFPRCGRPRRYENSYTRTVKTAISVPDELFRQADKTAQRLKLSRSQLYSTALREFLEKREPADVTARLDAVYANRKAKVDPALVRAQARSWGREDW